MTNDLFQRWWIQIAIIVWSVACAAGFWKLWVYGNTPSVSGEMNPANWQIPAELVVTEDVHAMYVFAHPKCPCTRATFNELERLQAQFEGRMAIRVVFFEPMDADASWRRTGLWAQASQFPNAEIIPDPGGALAHSAGATSSGTVGVFDPDGQLLFWGGITPSRGHEGESVGLISVRSVLSGGEPIQSRCDAFGCEIFDETVGTLICIEHKGCDE